VKEKVEEKKEINVKKKEAIRFAIIFGKIVF